MIYLFLSRGNSSAWRNCTEKSHQADCDLCPDPVALIQCSQPLSAPTSESSAAAACTPSCTAHFVKCSNDSLSLQGCAQQKWFNCSVRSAEAGSLLLPVWHTCLQPDHWQPDPGVLTPGHAGAVCVNLPWQTEESSKKNRRAAVYWQHLRFSRIHRLRSSESESVLLLSVPHLQTVGVPPGFIERDLLYFLVQVQQ